MNNLYTQKEACNQLRISRSTIIRLRNLGEIAFTMVGGQVRFTERHLQEFLRRNEKPVCRRY